MTGGQWAFCISMTSLIIEMMNIKNIHLEKSESNKFEQYWYLEKLSTIWNREVSSR